MPTRIAPRVPQSVRPAQANARSPIAPVSGRVPASQPSLLRQGASFFEQHREQISTATRGLGSARRDLTQARDIYRSTHSTGAPIARAATSRLSTAMRNVRLAGNVLRPAGELRRLPGELATANRNIRQAFRTGRTEDVGAALRSSSSALGTARNIVRDAPEVRTSLQIGARTLRRVAPSVVERLAAPAARLAESSAARIASRLAVRAAETSALRIAGRAAGRFVPGANIAIAALDTAEAVRTLRDPNSSLGSRITSVITAGGSIAAATNIPIVSQVGAAVSTVSSVVGAFFQ